MVRIGTTDWGEFPVILAPMEDITDSPFRRICKRFGVDVVVTEFISAEGLIRDALKSRIKMQFGAAERPIGIQIFGSSVDSMRSAAEVAQEAQPDFIDLNFGCPVRKIVMKGGGAALLQDIPKMIAIAASVVNSTRIPVTAKTRLGWDESHRDIVIIAEQLQDAGIRAITIHGRTRSQLYGGKADWTLIGAVKNNPRIHIPVIGNGDIDSGVKAKEVKSRYGVDGIMIGRAATGNPWIFKEIRNAISGDTAAVAPSVEERIAVILEHLTTSIPYKGERATLLEIRKLYSGYFKGVPDFKKYRMRLMEAATLEEALQIFEEVRTNVCE